MENEVLPPKQKVYRLRNNLNINYNDGFSNRRSMGWNNLIVGSHDLHSVIKAYVNIFNAISIFVAPTQPTNIITNMSILNQYSIKQGIKVFDRRG